MQQINAAYDEIQRNRSAKSEYSSSSQSSYSSSATGVYIEVRQKINERKYYDAERILMTVPEYDRVADWHFLMSVCLLKKGMINDSMRELEIACNMDPTNMEYRAALNQMARGRQTGTYTTTPVGGGCSACDVCNALICADCCCECMGGDLIHCC